MRLSTLSSYQLYQIWVTDPHLIQLIDLRTPELYHKCHIPGAILMGLAELKSYLHQQPELKRMHIAISNDLKIVSELEQIQMQYHNLLRLQDPPTWEKQGYATTGCDIALWIKQKGDLSMDKIIFHQLYENQSSTYTYIVGDRSTGEVAIIDPVLETVERDLQFLNEMNYQLKYILDTHVHADHITGASELRRLTGAKTAVSQKASVTCVDIPLEDGQELLLGSQVIKVLATPGHTDGCMSFYFVGRVFTGDSLMIRGCGRTDFQQGSSSALFESISQKLFTLPDATILCPGHDYRGFLSSTVGDEKRFNPRLNSQTSKESFIKTMSELKLADPKKIHEALPANLACGRPPSKKYLHPQITDGIPEVTVHQVNEHKSNIQLVDVRQSFEFNNEYGHIEGAKLVTLGPELIQFLEQGDKQKETVFICRSGGRSAQATQIAMQLGYQAVANMVGGMIIWNLQQLPVARD